jgi:hypothetical protein
MICTDVCACLSLSYSQVTRRHSSTPVCDEKSVGWLEDAVTSFKFEGRASRVSFSR